MCIHQWDRLFIDFCILFTHRAPVIGVALFTGFISPSAFIAFRGTQSDYANRNYSWAS